MAEKLYIAELSLHLKYTLPSGEIATRLVTFEVPVTSWDQQGATGRASSMICPEKLGRNFSYAGVTPEVTSSGINVREAYRAPVLKYDSFEKDKEGDKARIAEMATARIEESEDF